MGRSSRSKGFLVVGLAGLAACGEAGTGPGAEVRIQVAPLSLPSLSRVCYDLRVTNGPGGSGDVVWALGTPGLNGGEGDPGAVCSDRYGNDGGGDVAYVGPCDADTTAPEGRTNSVTLWVDGLYDEAGAYLDPDAADGWRDPCPAPDGCTLEVRCRENEDAPVTFDVTILRDANQGFFDVAVNFEDIFCSAKLDCAYGDETPIELLFDPATGERGPTAVLAVACTEGRGDSFDTALHMTPVTVTCDGEPIALDPSAGPGNAWSAADPDPDATDPIWQYAVYRGREDLSCPVGSCNAVYWNVAIGLDPSADCTIEAGATASTLAEMSDGATPSATTYPWIAFGGTLSSEGALTCGQNPLDAGGSAVETQYTSIATPKTFCHRFDGSSVSLAPACAACDFSPVDGLIASVQAAWDGLAPYASEGSHNGCAGWTSADLQQRLEAVAQASVVLADAQHALDTICASPDLADVQARQLEIDALTTVLSPAPIYLTQCYNASSS